MSEAPSAGPPPLATPHPMTESDRVARRTTFDVDPATYDAVRPTYPAALLDALAAYASLTAGSRVLEVAPGTGKASVAMAERGWALTGVELGPAMAALARERLAAFPDATVVTAAFEDWTPPDEAFEALVCATAWHWLDPATRLPRAHAALTPGAAVATLWTHHVAGGSQDFFDASAACYHRSGPGGRPDHGLPREEDLTPRTDEFEVSPLFTDVRSLTVPVEVTYEPDTYLQLLSTYSEHLAQPQDQRAALFACLRDLAESTPGGAVTKRYLFELDLARRIA